MISHRGEKYEIGRGKRFYGIWAIGAPYDAPVDRWPEHPDGWRQAWARFVMIEVPGTITTVTRERKSLRARLRRGPVTSGAAAGDGTAAATAGPRPGHGGALLAGEGLLVLGVVLGLAGLFPGYLGGQSLLSQWYQVIPHLCYVIGWLVTAALVAFSVARPGNAARLGALFGLGLGAVTLGLFIADLGEVVSGQAAIGSGLVVSLLGWAACTGGSALVLMSTAADFMLTGYLPTYLKVVVRVGHTAALVMITATLTILMLALVFVAWLSDHIGVKPIMWTGCGLLIGASIPAFLLIRSGAGYLLIFIGVLLIGLMELCFDSTSPAALPALFPTDVRYGALAIAYNISLSAVGGSNPLIAQALVSGTGNTMTPAYMLIFAGLVGAVTLPFTPEVAGRRLPGSAPAVETEEEARELVADE